MEPHRAREAQTGRLLDVEINLSALAGYAPYLVGFAIVVIILVLIKE